MKYRFFGYDIDDDFESAMESVGCLIETPALYDRMSAYQNLKAAARFYKYPDKRTETEAINNALSLVGLDKYSKDKAGSFAGNASKAWDSFWLFCRVLDL